MASAYNCTLTWRVENLSAFLHQPLDDFCAPWGEVETFNSARWRLTLVKEGKNVALAVRKVKGAEERAVDMRLSIVGTDGRANFPVYVTGFDFKSDADEVKMSLTSIDELKALKDYLMPRDHLKVRVEARLCRATHQELKTSFATVVRVEKCRFAWTVPGTSGNSSFPLRVHLDRAPDFTLVFTMPGALLKVNRSDGCADKRQMMMSFDITVSDFYGINNTVSGWLLFDKEDSKSVRTPPCVDYSRLDKIVLVCDFAFADGSCESIFEDAHYSFPSLDSQSQVVVTEQSVLGRSLYKDKKFADVTLRAGSKEFKSHKAVLSNASPVFNALLEKQLQQDVPVDIDLKPDVLKRVLEFVYTNKMDCESTFKDLDELYIASHKYVLQKLKDECSTQMISVMSTDNVSRILHLAYEYGDDVLKRAAKTLICEHPVDVLDSTEWERFMTACIQRRMAAAMEKKSGGFSRKMRTSFRKVFRKNAEPSSRKEEGEETTEKKEEK